MKTLSLVTKLAAGLSAAVFAFGCADSGSTNVDESSDEVIGGVPANSPKMNGIGALAGDFWGDGSLFPFCTGTLISPTAVLTAEHCIQGLNPATTFFAIGPNANAPERVVPVLGAVAEQTISGGVLGLGSDVAIVHLAEAVTDVPVWPVAGFPYDLVGERFTVVGYGIQDNTGFAGTRRAGQQVLQATSGRILEALFGSFQGWLDVGVPLIFGAPADQFPIEFLQSYYDENVLLDGYEAVVGNGEGDSNDCNGDSGGPLTKKLNGVPTVVGVVSWGWGSTRMICDFGGNFAVLGPASIDFIQQQLACPLGSCEP